MAKLLIPVILAGWVCGIALISVQNATPVSLHFLSWRSIQLPMGLVLAFSAALGMAIATLPLWPIVNGRN